MKYKTQKENARKIFYCDSFSGLNSADDILSLQPSQLSECVNLWNPNGVLSSRPGLFNSCEAHRKDENSINSTMYEGELNPTILGCGYSKIFAITEEYGDRVRFSAFITNTDNQVEQIAPIEIYNESSASFVEIKNALFINDANICESGVVLVLALCENYNNGKKKYVEFYQLIKDSFRWEKLNKENFYTPIILTDGRGNSFDTAYDPDGLDPLKPRLLEDVNIVNGKFKAYFRTDGFSWKFKLPIKDLSYKLEDNFYVNYSYGEQEIAFKITGLSDSDTKYIGGKEVACNVDREEGIISFTYNLEPFPLPYRVPSNVLCIEGVKNVFEKDFQLFGGKTQTILADARLLRSATEENSNRIYYSGKENNFYFSEDNYFEVGAKSEPITAMAFQNRYLFAFKENSIYRLKISDTASYDIQKIIEDGVKMADTTPSLTITRVHNTIGCDCASSVKFCQNRLVWYHSDGAVYTLYGTNTYTEGNVYTLSPNIKNLLDIPTAYSGNVSACVKDGYYFLNYKNKIFVMDGNVSGFTYLSGSPQKEGGGGLNWFYWELPANIRLKYLYSISRELFAVYEGNHKNSSISVATFSGEQDEIIIDAETRGVTNINVIFASSLFGTNIKEKKSLTKANMLLKGIYPVSFWLISEEGIGKEIKTLQSGKLKRQNLISSSKDVFGAGIRMKCIAPVVIADISFEYELH